MPARTTLQEVYRVLDQQPSPICREKFKSVRIPEIPSVEMSGDEVLEIVHRIISRLEYDDVSAPGYISYEEVGAAFANNDEGDNWEKIRRDIISRLVGYLKTLYGLPLENGEVGGWQMYDDQKPALKRAINYIMDIFLKIDPDQLASLFIMFVNGLIHCPTGQKEGVDTIILALLEDRTGLSVDLIQAVDEIIAVRKNMFFKTAVLTKGAENSQNVHLISSYEARLKEELGLSNILGYEERMGVLGEDPFNSNPANVIKVFYELVTPQRLVD